MELDALAESAPLDGAALDEDATGLRADGEAALGLCVASLGGLTGLDVDARGVASESDDSSIAFILDRRDVPRSCRALEEGAREVNASARRGRRCWRAKAALRDFATLLGR